LTQLLLTSSLPLGKSVIGKQIERHFRCARAFFQDLKRSAKIKGSR
jgi:hypothetical protein